MDEPRALISETQDGHCLKLLDSMRQGHFSEVEKALAEIERVYHYANSVPSWRGFHNLTHCFRSLLTSYLLNTTDLPQAYRRFPLLTAIGEAAEYDPNNCDQVAREP